MKWAAVNITGNSTVLGELQFVWLSPDQTHFYLSHRLLEVLLTFQFLQ
jgi:hypothetical protein